MINKGEETIRPRVFRGHGRRVKAVYHEQPIASQRGNPLIEALPPIRSPEECVRQLSYYPPFDPSERLLPNHLRFQALQDGLQFFRPLKIHINLEQKISALIRGGYRSRNPATKDFWHHNTANIDALVSSEAPSIPYSHTPTGMAIYGVSGMGKTASVERILSLYPQVIVHDTYQGKKLNLQQLVWIKCECPRDGSIKGICLDFISRVDEILGTDYCKLYRLDRGRFTVNQLIIAITVITSWHATGLIVIDEIQNLREAKSVEAAKMLNFLVQLINSTGVPLVLIGTYAAESVLSKSLHQIRRGSGQGDLPWDPMEPDLNGSWGIFLKTLFRYQYVRHPVEVTKELSDALHYISAGITDFAIKGFMLAQIRAIESGQEKITPNVILSAAKDHLNQFSKILERIRLGDKFATEPDDIGETLEKIAMNELERAKEQAIKSFESNPEPSSTVEILREWLCDAGIDPHLAHVCAKRACDMLKGETSLKVLRNKALSIWREEEAELQLLVGSRQETRGM